MGADELTNREETISVDLPKHKTSSLSVIILTFNEESNLVAALDSVKGWAAEVFVVDSYSTDRTVEIALERAADGVHVVQHRFVNYSDQWNWALSHLPVTSEWTLKLDADERVTPEFKKEADELLSSAPPDLHGVLFRRRFFFMGAPLRFGGVRDNYDLRLWRTGKAAFDRRAVNEHALVEGRKVALKSHVEHHDNKSVGDWLDKHNRYSSLEAISLLQGDLIGGVEPRFFGTPTERRMWLRKLYFRLPGRPLLYFLYRYFLQLGLLDGLAGFRFIFLYAVFLYWIDLKRIEYRATGTLPVVLWPPRGEPHPVVARSELQRKVDAAPPLLSSAPPEALSPHFTEGMVT
jgi:glycosyltransferase involved in cell wall biosynthesis